MSCQVNSTLILILQFGAHRWRNYYDKYINAYDWTTEVPQTLPIHVDSASTGVGKTIIGLTILR